MRLLLAVAAWADRWWHRTVCAWVAARMDAQELHEPGP